jgi:hypothetical protein
VFPLSQRKRSLRGRWVGLVVALAAAALYRVELVAWIAGDGPAPHAEGAHVAFYTCSMDPSVQADHPGNCPICGMALTPVSEEERSSGVVRIAANVRRQINLAVAPIELRAMHTRAVASGEVVADSAKAPDRAASHRAPDRTARDRATPGGALVVARIYRGTAGELQPGQSVAVAIPDEPLIQWSGVLEAPRAGDEPGQLRVRVADPDRVLRPGQHAEVQIDQPSATLCVAARSGGAGPCDRELAPRPAIPAGAVLQVGPQRVVFVDLGDGRFEPRTPKLGMQADGFVEVIDGLAKTDRVVIRGMFLLAAESRIRSDSALWSVRTEPAPAVRAGSRRSAP